MSVYEIANKLVLGRASRDEVYMTLFTLLAEYYWPNPDDNYLTEWQSMRDIREFTRLTAIPAPMVDEINRAALMAFV